jgi:hypothetical protein
MCWPTSGSYEDPQDLEVHEVGVLREGIRPPEGQIRRKLDGRVTILSDACFQELMGVRENVGLQNGDESVIENRCVLPLPPHVCTPYVGGWIVKLGEEGPNRKNTLLADIELGGLRDSLTDGKRLVCVSDLCTQISRRRVSRGKDSILGLVR